MKITAIDTFVVDAGWRPWQFVAVRTDEGVTGYGEMSDGRNPYGIIGTVADFLPILEGQDPLAVEVQLGVVSRHRILDDLQRVSGTATDGEDRTGDGYDLPAALSGFEAQGVALAHRCRVGRRDRGAAAARKSSGPELGEA